MRSPFFLVLRIVRPDKYKQLELDDVFGLPTNKSVKTITSHSELSKLDSKILLVLGTFFRLGSSYVWYAMAIWVVLVIAKSQIIK